MSTALQVRAREVSSKGELNRIRASGRVPGVVYGKGLEQPAKISVEGTALMAILRTHPYSVFEMDIPGAGVHPVMMTDLQRDSLSRKVMHIDFHRVNMNEKIKTVARLDISGSSAGEQAGGMLQVVLHEIEIECYPRDIPESVAVDISGLDIGDHLTVGELALPEGVELALEPDMVVIAVLAPQKERTDDELDALSDEAEEDRKHAEAAQAVEKS